MSSGDTRWALELAIVNYDKLPKENKDFIPVQHAITAHERAIRIEALAAIFDQDGHHDQL